MTEGTSTSSAPATAETAAPVAATAMPAASPAAPAAPVEAQLTAMAAMPSFAPQPAPVAQPAAPAVGPAAVALAAIEAVAAAEAAAAAKKAAAKAKQDDADDESMSDAETLAEVELAELGEAGATIAQADQPCGVFPVVDSVPVVDTPVVVPVGDAGFAFSPVLLGLLGLGAVGLGLALLGGKGDDDDDDDGDTTSEPPVAVNDTAAVTEDATVTGSVAINDSDPDDPAANLTYSLNGTVAGLTIANNGNFTFDASNAAYQDLGAGETEAVVATYTVTDDDGGTDTATLTITVTGVNDAPIAANDTAAATEGGAAVTGNVSTNDSDPDGDTLTYVLDAPVAGLTLNANGTFSFDPTDPAYNGLAAGATQNVVANYTVSDGNGGTDTATLTITVTGANDPPLITSGATGDVDENVAAGTEIYDANATDPDGNTLTFSLSGADAADLTIDAATGEVFVTNSPDFETEASYEFTVTVSDGAGGTDTQDVVVTVNDQVEVVNASLDVDNDANLLTSFTVDAGTEAFLFRDDDDIANNVTVINFGAEDVINFEAAVVAFTNLGNVSGGAGGELSITVNNGGVLSQLILQDAVAAGALVFDEATAEAAVAGTNNFNVGVAQAPLDHFTIG